MRPAARPRRPRRFPPRPARCLLGLELTGLWACETLSMQSNPAAVGNFRTMDGSKTPVKRGRRRTTMEAAAAKPRANGLLQDLQALGFSDYEARAYMVLLTASPATGYEVSKLASLPRANAYTVLESL